MAGDAGGGDGAVVEDRPYRELDGGRIHVSGYSYDRQALAQIRTVAAHGWVTEAALMADNHRRRRRSASSRTAITPQPMS